MSDRQIHPAEQILAAALCSQNTISIRLMMLKPVNNPIVPPVKST